MDKELLEAIGKMLDEKLEPIKNDIAELKETSEMTLSNVNQLISWADKMEHATGFPLPDLISTD